MARVAKSRLNRPAASQVNGGKSTRPLSSRTFQRTVPPGNGAWSLFCKEKARDNHSGDPASSTGGNLTGLLSTETAKRRRLPPPNGEIASTVVISSFGNGFSRAVWKSRTHTFLGSFFAT